MQNFNAKNNKRCAFCKHWYDPTNSAIQPKYPKAGMWEFDEKAESVCQKRGFRKKASMSCQDYECKV